MSAAAADDSSSNSPVWIYHERQEALLCGQHALNNLVQACTFSPSSLSEIAHQLDAVELAYMAQNDEGGTRSKDYLQRVAEGSANVDESGNFSIEVLRAALSNAFGLSLINIRQEGALTVRSSSSSAGSSGATKKKRQHDVTAVQGFICHRDSHWFAIRNISGRFWNLNSTLDRPEIISHFKLAAEIQALQDGGYSVFIIPPEEKLGVVCPECTSSAERSRGLPEFWWKESDLVKGLGSSATTGATDPWRNAGSGMRLDGKSTTGGGAGDGSGDGAGGGNIEGLTEEEMMQLALAQSLEAASAASSNTKDADSGGDKAESTEVEEDKPVAVPAEPESSDPNAIRIQFRFPDGSRTVRRFLKSDAVSGVYAYASERVGSTKVELRAGFPPVDLVTKKNVTVEEAQLRNETVQCRSA